MYSGYNFYDRPTADRKQTQVNDPNGPWYAQEAHWILIEDLMGGTYGMRKSTAVIFRRSLGSLMSHTTTA
jgi:hypothetical protein